MWLSLYSFQAHAIGHYLGDPRTDEAPITAYARALGYEHGELLKALKEIASGHEDPNYDEAENGEDIEALKRMYAGLPESDKERWRTLFPNWQQASP